MTKLFYMLFLIANINPATAQNLYFSTGVGYAFPLPGTTTDGSGNVLSGTRFNGNGIQSYHLNNASYSAGTNTSLRIGYIFRKNIGIELNSFYDIAPKKNVLNDKGVTNNINYTTNATITRQTRSMIILLPSIVLQTVSKKWSAYMKIGIALPFNTDIKRHDVYHTLLGNGVSQTDDYSWHIRNRFTLGFTSTIGLKYKISNNMYLFAEGSILYLSLFRKEAELQSVTSNGVSIDLSNVGGVQKITHNKSGVTDSTGAVQQSFAQPFSNLGLTVGISFSLFNHGNIKKEN